MFFFIPIGHEDSRMRRFPIVSLLIALACIFAFASTWKSLGRQEKAAVESIQAAAGRLGKLCGEEPEVIAAARDDLEKCRDLKSVCAVLERTTDTLEAHGVDTETIAFLRGELASIKAVIEHNVFREWGLVAASPAPITWLTHMFLHGGLLHLIGNLLFFILAGPTLEDLWGRGVYAAVYVMSGLAAAAGFIAMSGPVDVPMIGASGAIAGLMGAFLVAYTYTRIKVAVGLFLVFFVRFVTIGVPAWVFLPLWAGWEAFQGTLQSAAGTAAQGGTAHWAHVAGFVFGVAVTLGFKFSGLDRKLFPLHGAAKGGRGQGAAAQLAYMHEQTYRRGVNRLEEGRFSEAVGEFEKLAAKYPTVAGPRIELADAHWRANDIQHCQEELVRAVEIAAKTKDPRLLEAYEKLRGLSQRAKVSGDALNKLGLAYERAGKMAEALEHLQRFVTENPEHPQRVRATVRAADIMNGGMHNPEGAWALLKDVADAAASDPTWKEEVTTRLAELEKRCGPRKAAAPKPAPVPAAHAPADGQAPEPRRFVRVKY
jgi:membrane associated rhomboid family serine protease